MDSGPVTRLDDTGVSRVRARACVGTGVALGHDARVAPGRGLLGGRGVRRRGEIWRRRQASWHWGVSRDPVGRWAFAGADHSDGGEGGHGHRQQSRPPGEPAKPANSREAGPAQRAGRPQPGNRRDQPDWRGQWIARGSGWRLDSVMEGGGVFAPERVRGRWHSLVEIVLRRACPRGSPDRHQLLRGPQPIAWEPDDVLLIRRQPAAVFVVPIARFHGVCRPFFRPGASPSPWRGTV